MGVLVENSVARGAHDVSLPQEGGTGRAQDPAHRKGTTTNTHTVEAVIFSTT